MLSYNKLHSKVNRDMNSSAPIFVLCVMLKGLKSKRYRQVSGIVIKYRLIGQHLI